MIASCGSQQKPSLIEQPGSDNISESENALPDQQAEADSTLQIVLNGEGDSATRPLVINKMVIAEGNIHLSIVNTSKKIIHDISIAKMKNKDLPIAMRPDNKSIDTSASRLVEQVKISRIRPSKAAKVTTVLRPGYYLIYCTVSGHYAAGESVILTVVK
jgi:uncharacterized cupredoxin-like copper-binding protein